MNSGKGCERSTPLLEISPPAWKNESIEMFDATEEEKKLTPYL